ncbi:uncharacterized protein LOC143559758 [Bidens hawaiensis]|uniref:uncharacterized protein LOC143559758 n=1 Tax=Bidens hawaiensis TaxID=980011 RepID=UPI00404B6111
MDSTNTSDMVELFIDNRKKIVVIIQETAEKEAEVMSTFRVVANKIASNSTSSRPRTRRLYIVRDREAANNRLMQDYFNGPPRYDDAKFKHRIIQLYGGCYMRIPTTNDLSCIYDVHESEHSFPGMIGSLDCMHWEWGNCPTACRGQYTRGEHGVPTVSLQAICSHDLWVWSTYFGSVGSNNDINVLNMSPVLEYCISHSIPVLPFNANGTYYHHGYYLRDGIYPEYSIIMKTFQDPIEEKREYFKKKQASA